MKLLLWWLMLFFCLWLTVFHVNATDSSKESPFILIPKAQNNEFADDVDNLTDLKAKESKAFRTNYNATAEKYLNATKNKSSTRLWCDLWSMLASGIITRDTILCFLIRVVKFVANMALVVWSAMIIYAWYLYTITAITGSSVDETSQANDAIKNAAIGIVVVIFSYAIQRIVTQAFLT